MKTLHVEVNDAFLCTKVDVFKELCMTEGDYKEKKEGEDG